MNVSSGIRQTQSRPISAVCAWPLGHLSLRFRMYQQSLFHCVCEDLMESRL